MRYVGYLLGCVLLAAAGTVVEVSADGIAVNFSNWMNLWDAASLIWVAAVCVLALLGTGSLRALGRALRAVLRREAPLTAAQARESLAAWRTASLAALLAGLIGMMHRLDGADLSRVGISLNVACLSLYYGLFLDLLLLPVGAAMKRRLRELDQGERTQGSISVRSSRRRAG